MGIGYIYISTLVKNSSMVFSELLPLSSTTLVTHSDVKWFTLCDKTVESQARVLLEETKPETLLHGHMKYFSNLVETQIFKSSTTPSDTVVTFSPGNQTKSSLTLNPENTYNMDLEMTAPTVPILWSIPTAQLLADANRGIHTRTTCWRLRSSKYTAEKDAQGPEYEGML